MSFQLLVPGTQLVNALNQLDSLTGGATELVTLKYEGKDLWLYKESKKSESIKAGICLEVNGKKSGQLPLIHQY